MVVDKDKVKLTDSGTDTETGNEGLPKEQDAQKSLKALEEMYARGLIPEEVYEQRLKALKA